MLPLQELDALLRKPHISRAEIQLLWWTNRWPEPFEGVCEWRGERYWFDSVSIEDEGADVRFVVKLPLTEMEKLEATQALWERMVGKNNRLDSMAEPMLRDVSPDTFLPAINAHNQKAAIFHQQNFGLSKVDTSSGEVVGWFFWREDAEGAQQAGPDQRR